MAALLLVSQTSFAKFSHDEASANIPKFRAVSAAVYAGGNPVNNADGARGLNALVELGVRTVINLQGGDLDDTLAGRFSGLMQPGEQPDAIAAEAEWFESRQITFYNFPLKSHAPKTEIEDRDIRRALEVMAQATPEQPLFIHCEHGADRTGLLVALFRVFHQGWTPADAHKEWVKNGHGFISRLFTGHLDDYFYAVTGYSPKKEGSTSTARLPLPFKCERLLK